MILPSKELLSEVLNVNIETDEDIYEDDRNNVEYWHWINTTQYHRRINIYELAFKCKEWANKQNYDNNCFIVILYEDMTSRAIITEDGFGINADTEPEAIFKACEWIYKEMKK